MGSKHPCWSQRIPRTMRKPLVDEHDFLSCRPRLHLNSVFRCRWFFGSGFSFQVLRQNSGISCTIFSPPRGAAKDHFFANFVKIFTKNHSLSPVAVIWITSNYCALLAVYDIKLANFGFKKKFRFSVFSLQVIFLFRFQFPGFENPLLVSGFRFSKRFRCSLAVNPENRFLVTSHFDFLRFPFLRTYPFSFAFLAKTNQ